MPLLGENSPSLWTRRDKLGRALWMVVEKTAFRFSPRSCYGWRNFLLRSFGATIVDTPQSPARVFPDVRIHFPWKLELHAGCLISPGCNIYNLAPITLRDGATLSNGVHLCAGTHDYLRWSMPLVVAPIVVGENTWITTEVFVGPGVTIGELCVVGARSVVVKNLPARMVCAGNPCRPIKPRPEPL